MKLRVVIPVLGNLILTLQTLASLRPELGDEPDIVIVDNGSTDDSLGVLRADIDQPGSGIRLIQNPEPQAYEKSLNMGAALAGEWDRLLILNNDVILAPGAVAAMLASVSELSEVVLPLSPVDLRQMSVSGPKISKPQTLGDVYANCEAVAKWWEQNSTLFSTERSLFADPFPKAGGYCFLVTRRIWELLRGFDESFKLFGSDYDFFARARRFTNLVHERRAFVDHLEHQTVSWLGTTRDELMCRGRFMVAERHENLHEHVSVVIPTYNRTEALFEAIDSVLAQTFPHWKLYVIDDGSKDWDRIMTRAARQYAGNEGRIWFFHEQENRGPGHARNRGLELARGRLVAFLDSDDVWYRDHLETHVNLHSKDELFMSYSPTDFAWRWYDEESRRYNYRRDEHPEKQLLDSSYSLARLEKQNFIKTSSVVVNGMLTRRDGPWAEPVRFPVEEDHRLAVEDWRFFLEIARRGPVAVASKATARTHWSRNADADDHHSSRINPWASFGAVPNEWTARTIATPDMSGEVTVVIPTRERPYELARALQSIGEAPIIIGADGAATGREIRPQTQADPRLGLVILDKPLGPSAARNRAASIASSAWLWFLDDDDVAIPGWMEIVRPFLNDFDIVTAPLIASVDGSGLTYASGLFTSGLFVRTELFLRAGGFDEGINHAEERELFDRLVQNGGRHAQAGSPVAVKTVQAPKPLGVPAPRAILDTRKF